MSLRALLVGPTGQGGGEGVYMASLHSDPPDGVEYELAGDFHQGAPGADCDVVREIMLNQVVHRATMPDMGMRALRVRDRFDLIHVHAHPILLMGIGSTPVVMSEGSSSAVYLKDYLGWSDERLSRAYARARRLYGWLRIRDRLLALQRVSKAYVFSNWAREINLGWGADPDKLEVIYPGFPVPPATDRSAHENFTFLFVGGDFERKGGFEVVEAFSRLVGDLPHVRLMIVGSDPDRPNPDRLVHSWVPERRRRQLLEVLERLQRSGRLIREDWVDQRRLHGEIFPRADAFVMPTHAEGFGFTNVEAMSFGLPVITSTVGPATEIVFDGQTGLLVQRGDVDGLSDAMARLATSPLEARNMGEAGRGEFEAKFTRERFRRALGNLYRRVLET
jgi:glycosyltransferase involved in cell wall biosynthesis